MIQNHPQHLQRRILDAPSGHPETKTTTQAGVRHPPRMMRVAALAAEGTVRGPTAGSDASRYVAGCVDICLEGFGSASFEAALAGAERDSAELVIAAVTSLSYISHASEFPLNVARMAEAERSRFDDIESRLRTRLANSSVRWRMERKAGELVDVLTQVVDQVGATKVFVGYGSRWPRRLQIDTASRLRRRVRCELVEVNPARSCESACLLRSIDDRRRTCGR
jgi:hypothetical protein